MTATIPAFRRAYDSCARIFLRRVEVTFMSTYGFFEKFEKSTCTYFWIGSLTFEAIQTIFFAKERA